MAPAATDVPARFDVFVNGQGYLFLDSLEASLPFRTHKATYSYSPTFVERQNVQGSYGDNQQDFWLTASQSDWSLGEQQRYFHVGDDTSKRRYWTGTNIDVTTVPGQVTLADAVKTVSFASSQLGACGTAYIDNKIYTASSTNLFSTNGAGGITDLGAHGAGTPYARSVVTDGVNVYVGGATKLRKWNILTPGFSDFSASTYMALGFLNNTLFGIPSTMGEIGKFDTAGNYSTVYQWKGAPGTPNGVVTSVLPYGPKLLILRSSSEQYQGSELWVTDGTTTNKIALFPPNFIGDQMAICNGVVYIGGAFSHSNTHIYQSAVMFYANGAPGLLWKASSTLSLNLTFASVAAFRDGLVFTDETLAQFMFYNPATGGVSTLGTFSGGSVAWASGTGGFIAAGGTQFLHTRNAATTYFFPDTVKATTGTVSASLFDFDSSLTKYVKAIKVDFDAATDGNGGSVDISYQLNSVDGSYTSLQIGAVAGTEYTLGQSCRSISVKITINKGTSTNGPTLKRIYVRAAPVLQQFKKREYIVNCTEGIVCRDGSRHPKPGFDQVTDLVTALSSATPISITDRLGTYTGIIEPDGFEIYEIHANEEYRTKPGAYVVKVTTREV